MVQGNSFVQKKLLGASRWTISKMQDAGQLPEPCPMSFAIPSAGHRPPSACPKSPTLLPNLHPYFQAYNRHGRIVPDIPAEVRGQLSQWP